MCYNYYMSDLNDFNKPTASITVGSGEWFYLFGTVFFATRKKPNWFNRFLIRALLGIRVVSGEEREKLIEEYADER